MMSLLTIAIVGIIGCFSYFSPYVWRVYRVRRLREQTAKERILVLTYDDGPSSEITPAILDLLRLHNAKATFFMLGQSARKNPGIATRIIQEGHDAGCHSERHLNAWKVNPCRAIADINSGYESLKPWVTSKGMYRPPYGKITLPTYMTLRRRGAAIGWWTIDAGDTHNTLPTPNDVADRLLRDGGGIVLMHDLARSLERDDFVLQTTALLLDIAKREAFKIRRMSELCR